MFFYVDESGHTGNELFDPEQPTLYYGVLSSSLNLDVLAKSRVSNLRKRLGVARLHAAELGNGRLASIATDLIDIQKRFKLRFDFYHVRKPDFAIISFFDQVFDAGMNEGVGWTHYWTPLRYVLLLKVAALFDDELAKAAWQARIELNKKKATTDLIAVCQELLGRVGSLPDARSRQIITDALRWTIAKPAEISYNAANKGQVKQISPNIIGFQSVMHGIAGRLRQRGNVKASRIIVDRQSQFNHAQKTLADFFANAAGFKQPMGPGMPMMNFTNMPKTPIEFLAGTESSGLELVDVYLWLFKRVTERKQVTRELKPLINRQMLVARTDEVSLTALEKRWTQWFENRRELDEMTPEQVERGRQMTSHQDQRQQAAMAMLEVSVT